MNLVQCMGGWCNRRDVCQHYWSPGLPGRQPVERLCAPGQDEPEPIRVIPVKQGEPA
jgi:hypothetical protein